jgi:hypothetical protein
MEVALHAKAINTTIKRKCEIRFPRIPIAPLLDPAAGM